MAFGGVSRSSGADARHEHQIIDRRAAVPESEHHFEPERHQDRFDLFGAGVSTRLRELADLSVVSASVDLRSGQKPVTWSVSCWRPSRFVALRR